MAKVEDSLAKFRADFAAHDATEEERYQASVRAEKQNAAEHRNILTRMEMICKKIGWIKMFIVATGAIIIGAVADKGSFLMTLLAQVLGK